jgi:hypothetical protein
VGIGQKAVGRVLVAAVSKPWAGALLVTMLLLVLLQVPEALASPSILRAALSFMLPVVAVAVLSMV